MFGQLVCTTDQGQQMFNDQNTWWINNKRFEIEHDATWMRSEGELLDYSYDRWQKNVPMQLATTGNIGPNNASGAGGTQSTPNFLAPQGIEPGAATGNPPLTNDANLFGNNQLGQTSIVYGSTGLVTSIGGVTLSTASTTYATPWYFPDGRTGWLDVTTTSVASTIGVIGGLTISPAPTITLPSGASFPYVATYQAVGSTNVLGQPSVGELFTVPVQLTYTNATTATLSNIGGVPFVASSSGQAVAYGQISGFNPNCNQGFLDRVTIFQNTATYQYLATGPTPGQQANPNGAHIFYYRAVVPVKFLHDMFMQMKSPIINLGLNLTLYLTQQNGPAGASSIFPALQTSNNTSLLVGGQDNTGTPSIFYGAGFGGAEACRWYYRTVKFSPTDNARMAEMLTTGFTKSFKFISTDFNQASNIVAAGAGVSYQYQFATSSVHPLRCHAYFAPMINNGTTTINALSTFNYAPGVEPSLWNQTNVSVNNIPYYRQNFQNQQDQWEIIREQFDPDGGAMLMYTDFLGYKRYNIFDVTRLADRLPSPTEPVNLMFIGNRVDNLPYQLQPYFFIEKLNQITIRFSSADLAIVVGNLD